LCYDDSHVAEVLTAELALWQQTQSKMAQILLKHAPIATGNLRYGGTDGVGLVSHGAQRSLTFSASYAAHTQKNGWFEQANAEILQLLEEEYEGALFNLLDDYFS
jgi:hypothetical protein